jgi:hypothetical protein
MIISLRTLHRRIQKLESVQSAEPLVVRLQSGIGDRGQPDRIELLHHPDGPMAWSRAATESPQQFRARATQEALRRRLSLPVVVLRETNRGGRETLHRPT